MAFSYGLTFPAAFLRYQSVPPEVYPDFVKFYTIHPTTPSGSSDAQKRRPHLWTSLNGGQNWSNDVAGNTGFYSANYGGNLFLNSRSGKLEAWGHATISSSYSAYPAASYAKLSKESWSFGTARSNTNNMLVRDITRVIDSSSDLFYGMYNYNRYSVPLGFAKNTAPWSTAWTSLMNSTDNSWGRSANTSWTGDASHTAMKITGGFRQIVLATDSDHQPYGLVVRGYGKSGQSGNARIDLFNMSSSAWVKNYTSAAVGSTSLASTSVVSLDYMPGIGYLIFWAASSRIKYRILRTYNPDTGEAYSSSDYVATETYTLGESTDHLVSNGCHGWYCPWTKEYYLCCSANRVFWTTDGINWTGSTTTGAGVSAAAAKFLTDGHYMIVATSNTAFKYSSDKGTTWATGTALSAVGFNTEVSNDAIVVPFKCVNNVGIDDNNVTIGYWLNATDGSPTASAPNFYTNDYIAIDPSTSYVFFGRDKTTGIQAYSNRITFYDSSYNWISTVEGDNGTWHNGWPALTTSPSNAAYARISCRPFSPGSVEPTQAQINNFKWYFAKESDFTVMTDYGDIVCN